MEIRYLDWDRDVRGCFLVVEYSCITLLYVAWYAEVVGTFDGFLLRIERK